jgi:calcium permeable stress-gated cation channel
MMQALMVLSKSRSGRNASVTDTDIAVGLHSGFRSMEWISTIPPLFFVVGFKVYLKRKFQSSFHFYIPTQEELRNVTIHGRSDIKGKRLESRFGHPSLHAELFTPMVHAKMIPLLREFYKGKVTEETDKTKVNEYGGHSAHAQVLEGITIAAIEQVRLPLPYAVHQFFNLWNAERPGV